jgi:hypothetical protein
VAVFFLPTLNPSPRDRSDNLAKFSYIQRDGIKKKGFFDLTQLPTVTYHKNLAILKCFSEIWLIWVFFSSRNHIFQVKICQNFSIY